MTIKALKGQTFKDRSNQWHLVVNLLISAMMIQKIWICVPAQTQCILSRNSKHGLDWYNSFFATNWDDKYLYMSNEWSTKDLIQSNQKPHFSYFTVTYDIGHMITDLIQCLQPVLPAQQICRYTAFSEHSFKSYWEKKWPTTNLAAYSGVTAEFLVFWRLMWKHPLLCSYCPRVVGAAVSSSPIQKHSQPLHISPTSVSQSRVETLPPSKHHIHAEKLIINATKSLLRHWTSDVFLNIFLVNFACPRCHSCFLQHPLQ